MACLADLRLDEDTWNRASELRRREWLAAREDLIRDGKFGEAFAARWLLATPLPAHLRLEALDEDGYTRATVLVEHGLLADSVREYVAIIRRMDENANHRDTSWFEAVDMAKKVVHDRAAEILAREVPSLSADQATLRALFTFYFSLLVDTTTLHHARGHRYL
ncbi:MAG: hypothetical protein EOP08_07315 [Proteobacteria bacterium]|nr:MAG: hypothetical protein EOP08_07315 [Pseudomonadota bacterium]